MQTKKAVMMAFNELVETENTFNKITIPKPVEQQKPAAAAMPPVGMAPPPRAEKIHEVVSGDTLSKLAKKYYGSANQYMKIFEASRISI